MRAHSMTYLPSEYRNAMWASREESVFLCWLCISSSCCWVLETRGLSRVNNSFSSCFVKYLQFKLDSVSHCLKITYQSRLWNAIKKYTVHVKKLKFVLNEWIIESYKCSVNIFFSVTFWRYFNTIYIHVFSVKYDWNYMQISSITNHLFLLS